LAASVPLVFVVSALTFVLASLVPGDAARSILGTNADPRQYELLRQELGLNEPLPTRYWNWLSGAFKGNFGTSVSNGDLVSHQLGTRLGVTLMLVVGGVVVAAVVGVLMGLLSAHSRGAIGKSIDAISLLGAAVPAYWLGLLLAYLFTVRLQIFPSGNYVGLGDSPLGWVKSLTLPVLTLGLSASAIVAKQTRTCVLREVDKEYVRVLRSRGLGERRIFFVHVLRNCAAPILTVLGLIVVGLLAGTVLVERIFMLPGLGQLAVNATMAHDLPVIQGVTVTFAVLIVVINLGIELLMGVADPRGRR
jgi:peptide/nickel transport system permease protein